MRISDWSSDVCSSDLRSMAIRACAAQQDCNRRPRRPVCSAPRPEVEHVQAMFARLAGKPGMQPAVAVTHDEVARSSQRRLIEAPAQEIQVACRNWPVAGAGG